MTLEDVGRGLGWVGGVLYLLALAESTVRGFIMNRRLARTLRENAWWNEPCPHPPLDPVRKRIWCQTCIAEREPPRA